MDTFIGTKIVSAEAMNLGSYNAYRGWELPDNENPEAEGYLVEYEPSADGKANHPNHDGYISWSPKAVFEEAYHPVDELSFGDAILMAKKYGAKVARMGWNGKGMWVIYNPGSKGETHAMFEGSVYKNHGVDECEILPHFDMYTVNAHGRRAMLPGWLASQSDIDAVDWVVVD